MPSYALVSPQNVIDRIEPDTRIDPTVSTKAGWRWLTVVDQDRPALLPLQQANQVSTVNGDQVIRSWELTSPDLTTVKAHLKTRVDDDAERTRLKYITPGAGMAMTYTEKHNQACAVYDLGEAAANALTEAERNDQFPTLSASVGIEALTLYGCALLVKGRYEAFADLSAVIERTRLQGKKNISDASDAASAQAAYEAITWPSP